MTDSTTTPVVSPARPRPSLTDRARDAIEQASDRLSPVTGLFMGANPRAKALRWTLIVALYVGTIWRLAGLDPAVIASGVSRGALYGLIAVGLILIYRTNRIINFAVAAIGAVPAVLAVLLATMKGLPYVPALLLALVGGAVVGALADLLVIRRFSDAPRLIVTVATIGIAQILAFVNVYLPIWLGSDKGIPEKFFTPFTDMQYVRAGTPIFTGDDIAAVVAVVALAAALAAFLRFTRLGIALRASAENADRASLLGIPVKRVGTAAWAIAGLLAGATIFFRSPITGVPSDGSLGYTVLLFAFAAAVIARMESVPVAVAGGVAVGIVEYVSVTETGKSDFAAAMMLVFIMVALLVQRGTLSRAYDTGVSTWQSLKEYRPIPNELRNVREVVGARLGLGLAVAVLAVAAPALVSDGEVFKLTLLPIFAMVAVSLVILTAWAGQISLGQFAIVGIGAVTAGKLYADHGGQWYSDFWSTIIIGALLGAVVAVVIGLPALRIQGLFLAVTTLALAGAMQFYFLKRTASENDIYAVGRAILPSADNQFGFRRPILWGRIDLASETTFYYFALVMLAVVFAAAYSFRKHHSGRVLIATRDNSRASGSYGINVTRTKLAAFAVSGGIAGVAGVMMWYKLGAIDASSYGIPNSVLIFTATVMGGLTSLPGAVAGALIVTAVQAFGDARVDGLSFLVTGPGLLLILLFLPGGFAEGFFRMRDAFLRWVANRNGIHVPSLVADRRVEDAEEQESVVTRAGEHVEEAGFDALGEPSIRCPVCDEYLTLAAAADHEHLRATTPTA